MHGTEGERAQLDWISRVGRASARRWAADTRAPAELNRSIAVYSAASNAFGRRLDRDRGAGRCQRVVLVKQWGKFPCGNLDGMRFSLDDASYANN